ncbi:MAG: PilN domain-containing protein [Pseudomonadota bacterium]
MIRINLLPHRELRRTAERRSFYILSGLTAALGLAVVVFVHGVISGKIDTQNNRNRFLETKIAELDKQIEEIKKLKEQTQALLARKQVVETLQGNRTETVHLLDQLVRQLPDGVYLKSVKQTGSKINVVGYAQSNARISTLLRNFDSSLWLEAPKLVEIHAVNVDGMRLNEFTVIVDLTRNKQAAPAAGKGGAA